MSATTVAGSTAFSNSATTAWLFASVTCGSRRKRSVASCRLRRLRHPCPAPGRLAVRAADGLAVRQQPAQGLRVRPRADGAERIGDRGVDLRRGAKGRAERGRDHEQTGEHGQVPVDGGIADGWTWRLASAAVTGARPAGHAITRRRAASRRVAEREARRHETRAIDPAPPPTRRRARPCRSAAAARSRRGRRAPRTPSSSSPTTGWRNRLVPSTQLCHRVPGPQRRELGLLSDSSPISSASSRSSG